MKKLLYSIMALAGLTMASCTQEHIDVQYNPENVVAPVLGAIEDIDLSVDEADIVVEYTNADFNVATTSNKDLYMNIQGDDMSKKVKITAKFEDKITVKITDLYAAYLALGVEPGTEEIFDIMINAYLTTDKGALVAGTETLSNFVSVNISSEAFVAPTMGEFTDVVLKEKTPDFVIDYTEAEFNIAAQHNVSYGLYVDLEGNELKERVQVNNVTFKEGKMTIKAEELNKAVLGLDVAGGADADVDIAVVASVAEIKKSDIMSNLQTVNIKTYAANIPPAEKYNKVWVIGDYCSWDHAKTQFLFDYEENDTTFKGVIDFGTKAANGFKLTGVAGWDDTCNWGLEDNSTAAEEASSLQLITGGGSQDIKCYAKRFYGFEFDKGTLELKKAWGADQIGVIGLNGDWDNDIVMQYNPVYARFYADIEAAADTEMKFRADGGWDLNWGVDCANGGDNIPVTAGKYRVYFNPTCGLIEFNAKAYGTNEDAGNGGGTTPEPEPTEKVYGLVGTINSWEENSGQDFVLEAHSGSWLVYNNLTVTDADQFKIRVNHAWGENYGASGENEPFTLTAAEKYTLVSNGKNMSIAAGTYDVYFDTVTLEFVVVTAGSPDPTIPADAKAVKLYVDARATGWNVCKIYGWGDLGQFAGSWSGSEMTLEGDLYVWSFDAAAYGKTINIVLNDGNGKQTSDINNIVLNDDHTIVINEDLSFTIDGETPAPPAASDIKITVDVTATGWSNCNIYVWDGNETKYAGNWPGTALEKSGDVYVWTAPEDCIGKTVNVIFNNGSTQTGDINDVVMDQSHSFVVNADMSYTMDGVKPGETIIVLNEHTWGVTGEHNGWGDTAMTAEDGWVVAKDLALEAGKKFKIRADGGWDINYGHAEAGQNAKVGAEYELAFNGPDMLVETSGTYDVYFTVVDNVGKMKLIAK